MIGMKIQKLFQSGSWKDLMLTEEISKLGWGSFDLMRFPHFSFFLFGFMYGWAWIGFSKIKSK